MPRNDRECPRPNCGALIPREQFACRSHWRGLPDEIRTAILLTWARLRDGELGAVDEHETATRRALDWWAR